MKTSWPTVKARMSEEAFDADTLDVLSSLLLAGVAITASATELNLLAGATSIAKDGGATGSNTTPAGTVSLEIAGTTYYLLRAASLD